MSEAQHIPVMLNQVLDALCVADGKTYVDATFGFGGYTSAILEKANCKVIALDRDPNVLPRVKELSEKYGDRFCFIQSEFSKIAEVINHNVDGVVFDIGVSSMQLDQAHRGFSFSKEAPLDMRMSCSGISAADIVNEYKQEEIASILYNFGQERKSRQIADKICQYRRVQPIETTTQLAQIIYSVLPKRGQDTDPATRTFQALRIAVNDELGQLEQGLVGASKILTPSSRLVVVSFHSLEDKIVKEFFNQKCGKNCGVSRYLPQPVQPAADIIFTECSKAILPTAEEVLQNRRSRSAKMRYAIKK